MCIAPWYATMRVKDGRRWFKAGIGRIIFRSSRAIQGMTMLKIAGIRGTLALLAASAIWIPPAAVAEDADTREVQAYVLTEAALAKYVQATRNLAAKAHGVPGDCDDDSESQSQSQSISQTVAKMNAVPGVRAAIQNAGMTTREYIVFSWSVLQNGMIAWALDQPGGKLPPGASMANVNFYRKHAAEIQRLAELNQSSDCDEEVEGSEEG